VHGWLDVVLDGPVAAELTGLVTQLDPHARNDSLGQKLLALTVPGVPDVYQGTELWEDSSVDPDNRRAVDYVKRRTALTESIHPKLRVVRSAALRLRRERPAIVLNGGYTPLLVTGRAAEHLVAFRRGADVLVAVTRLSARLSQTGWVPPCWPCRKEHGWIGSPVADGAGRWLRPTCSPICRSP
jgi:(1->4)-alpha-D-glucan 1-alpha-D-glucosylmutase